MTRIVMAAVAWEGKVYAIPAPARHHTVLWRMDAHLPDLPNGFGHDQGFITDAGDYVRRSEAWWLAAAAGQIERGEPRDLFSEDLW